MSMQYNIVLKEARKFCIELSTRLELEMQLVGLRAMTTTGERGGAYGGIEGRRWRCNGERERRLVC